MMFRLGAVLISAVLLSGCKTPVLPMPPFASVGDAQIAVNVKAGNGKSFPKGSRVVVVLADISGKDGEPVALGGDSIPMSQADSKVRVSFPADVKKMRPCREKGRCGVLVQVVGGSSVALPNEQPVNFRLGQGKVDVVVE